MLLYLWMMVQIICESLPISSSGHVVLLQKIMDRCAPGVSSFAKASADLQQGFQDLWAFDYVLQGVSAVIFLIYFFSSWWQLVVGKPIRIWSLFDGQVLKNNILPVLIFGFVADSMTFLLWYVNLAERLNFPLAFGFMITATVLWNMQFMRSKKDVVIWSWKNGAIVGLMQGFALLPGISRFGITMASLQWLGYPRHVAFPISFLIQWPLIVAGSLQGFYSLHDTSILQVMLSAPFLMVVVLSSCIAYGILYGIEKLINKNLLWKFSYYMIIPIIIALLF